MYTNMNPDSEPWNIALVDNDALVRSYLETYLGGLPEFNICWSMQSGRDAVEAYHHSIACTNCVPDLIVTDLSMHGMSGFELCATIRFENDHTPILGCSSYMIEPYERDAVNNGMQGLLLKNELAQLADGMLGFFMMVVRNVQILVWKFRHWGDDLERFVNYDGDYYENNRICFEPKVKDVLELAEKEAAELLEKGE